jgi:hypothetical protein
MKSYIQYITEKHVPDSEDIEMSELKKVETANKQDLKEYPGKKGKKKHHGLHQALKSFVGKMKKMHKKYKK